MNIFIFKYRCKMPPLCKKNLKLFYNGRTDQIVSDKDNKPCVIYDGTKQDDVINSSLFNVILKE